MALIRCSDCEKEFSDKAKACPNCGCPRNDEMEKVEIYENPDPIAITGFVLSLVSLFIEALWGFVGIAAIIFSIIGVIITFKKNKKGKTLAILGIVFGVFGTAVGITTFDTLIDMFR